MSTQVRFGLGGEKTGQLRVPEKKLELLNSGYIATATPRPCAGGRTPRRGGSRTTSSDAGSRLVVPEPGVRGWRSSGQLRSAT